MAIRAVAHEWTCRGPATLLTPLLVEHYGARNLADLVEGFSTNRLKVDPADALLVFKAAAAGDPVALDLVRWAGYELGKLANGVIRQLGFQELDFEVVLVGSMYDGNPLLIETMRETIHSIAPGAKLVRLTVPPVVGAVLLGMEQAGFAADERSTRKPQADGLLKRSFPVYPPPTGRKICTSSPSLSWIVWSYSSCPLTEQVAVI